MKMTSVTVLAALLLSGISSFAMSPFDGVWASEDGRATVRLTEFNNKLTMHTRSYYDNGAPSDYFFEFRLPKSSRPLPADTIIEGRVRSLDGYYGCVFDEKAQAMIDENGRLRIHHPLLTFYRETRTVVDDRGYRYRRAIDWNGWGWVENIYYFPIRHWRTVSSECVVTQRNWTTAVLVKYETEIPVPR
ncbi:hypothetical protein D3C87_145280 [compost metagenome]